MRLAETHISRSSYVIAFETPPIEKRVGAILPDYSPTGEILASYMSVLFGKRFDCHGLLEGSGFFQTPSVIPYSVPCDPKLPFNSHNKRRCFEVELNITQVSRIEGLFIGQCIQADDLSRLQASCTFYMQALQNAEYNTEVAYLHMITAGEVLSGCFRYSDTKGVKEKFVRGLRSLLDDDFFLTPESQPIVGTIFTRSNIDQSIRAAYDLRSRYVHTAAPFATWVDPFERRLRGDLQFGTPVMENKDLGEVLASAPTFLGLERLVRYCILAFMESRGLPVRGPNQ